MHELNATSLQRRLVTEVGKTLRVLHLSHTDGCTTHIGQFIGTHLREHTRQVDELMGIFVGCPMVRTLGQELIVVLPRIVTGIKQVLKIVEAYRIGHLLFRCLRDGKDGKEQQEQHS